MYFIKKTYEATEENQNFYGKYDGHQIWIEGKGGYSMRDASFRIFGENEYGYITKVGALKGLEACQRSCDWENKFGHWKVSCELIEL